MKEKGLVAWIVAAMMLLIAATMLGGCSTVAKDFTARTVAVASKDGFSYDSTKNQEKLKASGEIDPNTGVMKFSVETTATTPESAIAAALEAQKATMELINKLLDKVISAAASVK